MVEPGEVAALRLAILGGFLIFASYNVVRPMRDQVGAELGARALPWLMTGTLVLMVLVSPAVSWLVSRYSRRVFIPVIFRFFVVCLAGFGGVAALLPAHSVAAGVVLFLWTGVFNLLTVSVYWGFLSDTFSEGQAQRLFGVIGVGGTLGAIAGAAVTAALAPVVPVVWLYVLAAVMLEMSVRSLLRLDRTLGPGIERPLAKEEESPGSVVHGLALILRSRYLAGIGVYMLLFAVTSTVLYFEQARIIGSAYESAGERTAVFARIDLFTNVLTVLAQLFLTGRVMTRWGVGRTLAVTPLVTAAGLAVLAVSPALGVITAVQVLRRGLHYAADRPAREVLYTVLSASEKYKSKSFIDTFIYRAGDLVGAWLAGALSMIGGAGVWAAIPISAAWLGLALWLGSRHRALAAPAAEPRAAAIPS
jgi:AAA family ATP:ADP antiporter